MTNLAPPLNIFSGCKAQHGLGAALTNPTLLSKIKGSINKEYPQSFKGKSFDDAETAYEHHRVSQWQEIPTPQADLDLMISIIMHKFWQHPRLLLAVTANGGVEWLETCEHFTNTRSKPLQWWEGKGRNSPMIAVLIEAYKRALTAAITARF